MDSASTASSPHAEAGFPLHLQALGMTALVAGALLVGAVMWTHMRDEGPEGERTFVVSEAEGGRLLLTYDAVSVGKVAPKGFSWSALDPADNDIDTAFGRVLVAAGPVPSGPLTEARLVFGKAGYVAGGALHDLVIPSDRLELRVPGAPGEPGDTLLVVFDVKRSIAQDGTLLVFTPFVSHAEWLTPEGTPRADAREDGFPEGDEAMPWQSRDNSTGKGGGGGGGTGGGKKGGGDNGGGDGGDDYDDGDRGSVTVFVRDVAKEQVEHLNVTFAKVAVGPVGGDVDDAETYFQGARTIDVRAYDGADDRAELVTFQLPVGDYGSLHLEFSGAEGVILDEPQVMLVPQPRLVIEVPFTVQRGAVQELLVDFSIEESLVLGGDGWEFRPVAYQFQRGSDDVDGDGVSDVRDPDDDDDGLPDMSDPDRDGDLRPDEKPRQFRFGGSSLPSIGHANEAFVEENTGQDAGEARDEAEGTLGGADDPGLGDLLPDDVVPGPDPKDDVPLPAPGSDPTDLLP